MRERTRHALAGGLLFKHYSHLPDGNWIWPNFTPQELSCKHCGEFYWLPSTFDALQRLRDATGRPIRLNSAHRCKVWNYAVGGAPKSAHLHIAADIAQAGHDPAELLNQAKKAGFRSFGLYNNFIHVDERPGRFWFGSQSAREHWNSIL